MFKLVISGLFLGLLFTAFKLRELYRRNKELSRTDSKTGALSERGFIEVLGDENRRSRRNLRPLTVTYIDLDNFRLVNKVLGYNAADEVLRVVARTMQSTLREVDFVARIHGDEFALLLPETGAEDALLVLDKLQKALRNAMAVNQWPVTFSIGAVSFNSPLATPEDMIKAASNVMQSSAKQGGKDRVQHVTFESRERPECLVKCSNCGVSFVATSHPFCPTCGDAALSDSAPEKATATESKRADGICAFRLPLEGGKLIEFYGPADITREETDAIVSATNSSLRGGGNLERAIRRAGGPAIRAECEQIVAKVGRLAEGKAVITTGGKLPAKYVVHTVAPFYRDGNHGEAGLLASCYRESVRVGEDRAIKSLAFPSLGTGCREYLASEAAHIAVSTVVEALGTSRHVQIVRFVLFDAPTLRAYTAAAEEYAVLDAVTGLPNSRRLFADLDRALLNPEQGVALLLVDVDEFEEMNSEYGRSVAANVLRAVGQMLLKQRSQRATFYRWGGDEFAALLAGTSRADVLNLAESIRADVSGLSFKGHPDLRVTVRVGVAFAPDDGNTRDQLAQSTDTAAFRAMRDGGNCVRTYNEQNAQV